jgi:hypothetical protein
MITLPRATRSVGDSQAIMVTILIVLVACGGVRKNPGSCSGIEGNSPSSLKSSRPTTRIGSLVRDMPGTHLAAGKASLAQGASVGRRSGGSSRFVGSAPVTGGPTPAPSSFPYGLSNAATGYSHSMHPTMNSYMGLPEYHLCTPFELSTTTSVPSTTGSSEDSDGCAGVDSSGLHSPEDLR